MALSWQGEKLDHPERSVEELARITCPVLLTKGTRTADWLKRLVDVLRERLPNASVVELAGDHAHHIESIDAFLGALDAHLTGTEEARIA
jgi:pimeloyl-ACP methyl ester carboxylesterase